MLQSYSTPGENIIFVKFPSSFSRGLLSKCASYPTEQWPFRGFKKSLQTKRHTVQVRWSPADGVSRGQGHQQLLLTLDLELSVESSGTLILVYRYILVILRWVALTLFLKIQCNIRWFFHMKPRKVFLYTHFFLIKTFFFSSFIEK